MAKKIGVPVRKDDLLVQKLGEETIVYDLSAHRAHSLNRTAGLVFEKLDGKRDVDAITGSCRSRSGAIRALSSSRWRSTSWPMPTCCRPDPRCRGVRFFAALPRACSPWSQASPCRRRRPRPAVFPSSPPVSTESTCAVAAAVISAWISGRDSPARTAANCARGRVSQESGVVAIRGVAGV